MRLVLFWMGASVTEVVGQRLHFILLNLPNLGKATIKTSAATTMISGSTAAREPMPLHFEYSTTLGWALTFLKLEVNLELIVKKSGQ